MRGVKNTIRPKLKYFLLLLHHFFFNTMLTYLNSVYKTKHIITNYRALGQIPPPSFGGMGVKTPIRLLTMRLKSNGTDFYLGTNFKRHSVIMDTAGHMAN